jgi:hypothetical protein
MENQYQYQLPVITPVRNFYRANPSRAILLGVGAVVLAPTVLPLLKPIAKATIKTGVSLYEKSKGAIAESGEVIGDLVAEAKAEVQAENEEQLVAIEGTNNTNNTHNFNI